MGRKKIVKNDHEDFEKEYVAQVLEDFRQRQIARKPYDTKWQLNVNFYTGNQHCAVDGKGDVVDNQKQYFWEERQVYNHIAPILDLRLSKLSRVRPTLNVIPFSDNVEDVSSAKVSKKILNAISYESNISKLLSEGTTWSEICGTSFYKIGWNEAKGRLVGKDDIGNEIHEGDIEISVVSPFEIYPDSNTYSNIEDCASIIHARALHVDTVRNIWGVEVEGKDIDCYTLETTPANSIANVYSSNMAKKIKKNHVLVLEKYEQPSVELPDGRVSIIAGDKLLYMGELPYINHAEGRRGYPFVKQVSNTVPNSFWGTSIIERLIPIQKSYNAIKNRKHEFLNRLSMGVFAVEDGSCDIENLEEEGMMPGKVVVYRNGSTPPRLLNTGNVPIDFQYEEKQLLNEFIEISGVSDLITTKSISGNLSGTALQLLIEQDEVRMLTSAENLKLCVLDIAKMVLRLYKQFAVFPHTTRLVGNNGAVELLYWKGSNLATEDVVFETDYELNQSLAQKRSSLMEALGAGLLHDEDGKLSNSMRHKILSELGFDIWENTMDEATLQSYQAEKENVGLIIDGELPEPSEIDDHDTHIKEHRCFILSNDFKIQLRENPDLQSKMLEHIRQHKKYINVTAMVEEINTIE
ncbi:MAG: hypothetical protein E7361_00240 [Clostridiales bacterium]|nr:hypothetical protein [Clostridiales bacterium]